MQFLILGCGTIIPQQNCFRCSGYLLDNTMLLDCGPGIWHALCKEHISIAALKYILFSHFHVDHTGDLAALLATRYMLKKAATGTLTLIGPPGLLDWYSCFKALLGDWVDGLGIAIVETADSHSTGEYMIETGKTAHTENSICYRISDRRGKIVFYSGDAGSQADLISLAQNADLAVIEASHGEQSQEPGHLTPTLAAEIARQAGVKRLVLTHRYPEVSDSAAMTAAQQKFKGEIYLAADGLKILV
jgi:ribonuclease BN (tRNA processing enzyme)